MSIIIIIRTISRDIFSVTGSFYAKTGLSTRLQEIPHTKTILKKYAILGTVPADPSIKVTILIRFPGSWITASQMVDTQDAAIRIR